MWEINDILSDLFEKPIEYVLELVKKMRGILDHYIGTDDNKEKILQVFLEKKKVGIRDFLNWGVKLFFEGLVN